MKAETPSHASRDARRVCAFSSRENRVWKCACRDNAAGSNGIVVRSARANRTNHHPTSPAAEHAPLRRCFLNAAKNTCREEVMTKLDISRRTLLQGSAGFAAANLLPGAAPLAHAATMEESI